MLAARRRPQALPAALAGAPQAPSGPACRVPSSPWGQAGAGDSSCLSLGWFGCRRCQVAPHWPSRPDQGLAEGPERAGARRAGRRWPRREPPAASARSGDVIRGTNGSLAQRRFPAAGSAPGAPGCGWGQPRPRSSPQRLYQLGKEDRTAPLRGCRPAPGLRGGGLGGLCHRPDSPPPLLQLVPPAHSPAGTMNVFDRNINFDALFKFSHM